MKETGNTVVGLSGFLTLAFEKMKETIKPTYKNVIDVTGKGGGYIMSFGTAMDEGNATNIHTMFDVTKEYGVYR